MCSFFQYSKFKSPTHAVLTIMKQADPMVALLEVVKAGVLNDDIGFISEVLQEYSNSDIKRKPLPFSPPLTKDEHS